MILVAKKNKTSSCANNELNHPTLAMINERTTSIQKNYIFIKRFYIRVN